MKAEVTKGYKSSKNRWKWQELRNQSVDGADGVELSPDAPIFEYKQF